MTETNDIKLNFDKVGSDITVSTRIMLPEEPNHSFVAQGTMGTVYTYIVTKGVPDTESLQRPTPSKSLIYVNRSKGTINLKINPTDAYSSEIKSSLELSEHMTKFYINTNKMFGQEELLKLIRFNRLKITSADKIISELKILKFKSSIDVTDEKKDNRSQFQKNQSKKVETNLPEQFIIVVPIYKGYPPIEFGVDLIMQTTETTVSFALESTELAELIESQRESYIDEEVKALQKTGIAIIFEN